MIHPHPGPELDAKIADMLGYVAWKETRGQYTLCFVMKPTDRHAEAPWKQQRDGKPDRYERVTCVEARKIGTFNGAQGFPKFSTNIGDAWEVFEKMVAKATATPSHSWLGIGKMWVYPDGHTRVCKWAVIYGDYCEHEHGPLADSAQEAICLAALAAVAQEQSRPGDSTKETK